MSDLSSHPFARPSQSAAQRLLSSLDGVRAVVMATPDGFALARAGSADVDAEKLAAIVSSLGALGQAASRETGIGDPRCMVVESTAGRLVVRCFRAGGHDLILAVLTDLKTLLGLVWSELRNIESELEQA